MRNMLFLGIWVGGMLGLLACAEPELATTVGEGGAEDDSTVPVEEPGEGSTEVDGGAGNSGGAGGGLLDFSSVVSQARAGGSHRC